MNLRDKIEAIIVGIGISSSKFADDIGVTRPIISHILTERNKPSLEIIQKIIARFPELGYDWIGDDQILNQNALESIAKQYFQSHLFNETDKGLDNINAGLFSKTKEIDKIVVFYKDKTFDTFTN